MTSGNQSSMNNQLDIIEESIQGILDSFDQLPEVITPKMEKKETIFPLKNNEKTRKTLQKPEKTLSKKFPENTSKCPTLFKSASTSSLDSSKNSSISSINHICLVANCSKCRNNSNRTSGLVSPNPNTPRNSNSFSFKGPMVFNSINYKNDLSKLPMQVSNLLNIFHLNESQANLSICNSNDSRRSLSRSSSTLCLSDHSSNMGEVTEDSSGGTTPTNKGTGMTMNRDLKQMVKILRSETFESMAQHESGANLEPSLGTSLGTSLIKPSPGVIGLASLCQKSSFSPSFDQRSPVFCQKSPRRQFDVTILKDDKFSGLRRWHSQPSLSGFRIHCFTCNEQVNDFLKTVHGGCLFNCNNSSTFQTPSHGAVGEIKDILYKLEDILTE